MKIKPIHYEYIRKCIEDTLEQLPKLIEEYETGKIDRADKVNNLQQRFNFDLLFMSVGSHWVCEHIYPYANDTNLKTVLNRICPKIERKY